SPCPCDPMKRRMLKTMLSALDQPPPSLSFDFNLFFSLDFQGDVFTLNSLGQRNGDFDYPIFKGCCDSVSRSSLGQAHSPFEATKGDLAEQIVFLINLLLRFAFTRNGENVMRDADFNILRIEARNISAYNKVVAFYEAFDWRHELLLV